MIKIQEAIVVEGIYDKTKLEQFIKGVIIITDGFRIFKDKENMLLLKKLAQTRGIVVLTDSDRAGFLIRNYIKECVPTKYVKHAYIPEVKGKERRKAKGGKEGLLGVEGVSEELIIDALKRAGCTMENHDGVKLSNAKPITKYDLYLDGLTGKSDSKDLRNRLKKELNLPSRLSTNSLLEVLNALLSYEEYKGLIENLREQIH